MKGLLRDTWAEMIDRKIIYIYGAATLVGLLFLLLARSAEMQFSMQGETGDLDALLGSPVLFGLNKYLWLMVFVTVMVSLSPLPNMLSRGRADYYLSKPVTRAALVLNKTTAVWLVYGGLCAVSATFLWLVAGAFFQTFSLGFVWLLVINLLTLAVWLSVIAFAGVLSRTAGHSILMAFALWLAQAVLASHEAISAMLRLDWGAYVLQGLYYIMPKTGQMSDLAFSMASDGSGDLMPLWTSLLFAVVLLWGTLGLVRSKEF